MQHNHTLALLLVDDQTNDARRRTIRRQNATNDIQSDNDAFDTTTTTTTTKATSQSYKQIHRETIMDGNDDATQRPFSPADSQLVLEYALCLSDLDFLGQWSELNKLVSV